MKDKFHIKAALAGLKSDQDLMGKDGVLTPLVKQLTEAAETALDELEHKWGDKYPTVIRSWRKKWHHLSAYFKYHPDIRKVIYTTNAIESVHRHGN